MLFRKRMMIVVVVSHCRGGGGSGIDTGVLQRRREARGERERESGGRWQVQGRELMVVTAVAGRQVASVLLGESHKQGHRESQE